MRLTRPYIFALLILCGLLPSASIFGQGIGIGNGDRDPFDVSSPPAKSEESLEDKVNRLREELAAAELELAESQKSSTPASDSQTSVSSVDIPTDALVVITGDHGSGSGFVAEIKGRRFLVTNIHVLGAARGASFTTVDGVEISLGKNAFLSKGRDIAIVPIEWEGRVFKLSPSLRFDEVAIGQKITVMGNSGGASVATRLSGEVRGIGPTEVEVSAKFVPGNSGSPIVHDTLGTVIAVASHLKDYSSDSKWTEDTEFDKIRRFGYRLDGEISWEQVALSALYNQGDAFAAFEDRTSAMWNISYMLTFESKLLTSYRDHDSIGYLYEDISSDFNWGRGTASAHNTQMLRRFVNGMMSEVQSDLSDADRALSLSFYQRQYDEIKGYRETIRKNLIRFSESRL
ncbi:MAG: S1 family peptidase [Opitutaceae bacterium]